MSPLPSASGNVPLQLPAPACLSEGPSLTSQQIVQPVIVPFQMLRKLPGQAALEDWMLGVDHHGSNRLG